MSLAVLEPGGGLARSLREYEDRPGQRRMATAVQDTLMHGGISLIEAGTGTGKTLAYLVPAVLSGMRVVISTGTKALQDQIAHDDLPLVRELLDQDFEAALVKGTANYLCKRRLAAEMSRAGRGRESEELHQVAEWAQDSPTGDRSELSSLSQRSPLWQKLSTSSDGRLGGRCPHFDHCFTTRARRRAEKAELVIVNHHLFFADLAVRARGQSARVLPDYDAVIFDEAHLLEGALTEHFAASVSSASFARWVTELASLAGRFGGDDGALFVPDRDLQGRVDDLSTAWKTLMDVLRQHLGGKPGRAVISDDLFGQDDVKSAWYAVDDRLAGIATTLERGSEDREGAIVSEAELFARRCGELRDSLAAVADGDPQHFVRFSELTPTQLTLKAAPVDVSTIFSQHVLGKDAPVVLTSATLSCAGSFEYLKRRLGVPEDQADEHFIESPFDYSKQALLYVATDLPDPRDNDYPAACTGRIAELVDITDGRTLVLFTSHRLLERAARDLREWLDHPVLVQGDAAPATLLGDFRTGTSSVLLATGTFWQGIDVPGESLSQVIIDKLPFSSPEDPLAAARGRREEEMGRDPFYGYQVPQAALTFCQGVGRLIRRKDDRGLISILDKRLIGKRYGERFIASLPENLPRTGSIERARRWWDRA